MPRRRAPRTECVGCGAGIYFSAQAHEEGTVPPEPLCGGCLAEAPWI